MNSNSTISDKKKLETFYCIFAKAYTIAVERWYVDTVLEEEKLIFIHFRQEKIDGNSRNVFNMSDEEIDRIYD